MEMFSTGLEIGLDMACFFAGLVTVVLATVGLIGLLEIGFRLMKRKIND